VRRGEAIEFRVGSPIGYLFMFLPSGTNRDEFEAMVAGC
jgi:hypothetical protein